MSTVGPVGSKSVNPLLAKYLVQLATHPLRTKAATSGIANSVALRELVAAC